MNSSYDIIIKPVMSEKSYDGIKSKKYTFVVDKRATRTQIKQAIEEIFSVQVEKINTLNIRGKIKRQGKYEGLTPSYKKAIVQLKKGSKTIELFDSLA